jgi:hypothetical protein
VTASEYRCHRHLLNIASQGVTENHDVVAVSLLIHPREGLGGDFFYILYIRKIGKQKTAYMAILFVSRQLEFLHS